MKMKQEEMYYDYNLSKENYEKWLEDKSENAKTRKD